MWGTFHILSSLWSLLNLKCLCRHSHNISICWWVNRKLRSLEMECNFYDMLSFRKVLLEKKKKYQMNIWSWPFYNYVLSRRIERQFWKFYESFVLTLFIVTHYIAASIYCYCNGNNFIIFNSESELHM